MRILSADDSFLDIVITLRKSAKRFALPLDDEQRRRIWLAINVIDINSREFDRKYNENSLRIGISKREFFKLVELVLLRLTFVGFKPRLFSIPDIYGERFRALFSTDHLDLEKRLKNRLTTTFKGTARSPLHKLKPSSFEFLLCTKNSSINKVFSLLNLYSNKESPLHDSIVVQLIADRCISENHLRRLNKLVRRVICIRRTIYHGLWRLKVSHLKISRPFLQH